MMFKTRGVILWTLVLTGLSSTLTWVGSVQNARDEVGSVQNACDEDGTEAERLVRSSDADADDDAEMPHRYLRTLTDADGAHPIHLAQVSFLVKAFGISFVLDLELNHDLLSSNYVERHFDEDGQPFQSMGGEHCYYHGSIRGILRSWAALSTCHGLETGQ